MDFIVSYHLYNKMKKKESPKSNQKGQITQKESSKSNQGEEISQKNGQNTVNPTCSRCGQDPYFCQCKNNVKAMYKYFNPEKDVY
jgi:hypothetical protein